MGDIVLKTRHDADLFVVWSSIVEAPTFVGDAAETLAYLQRYSRCREPCCLASQADRIVRAMAAGTSALYGEPFDGAWDDSGFIVEQQGWLPRERLHGFALDVAAGLDGYAYLEPFADEAWS